LFSDALGCVVERFQSMLVLLCALSHCDPFGIDPALSGAYKAAINQPNNSFTCLDHSQSIPLSALNDGKCDCPDSSDEPGTSACLNGHFYCPNVGANPRRLPSHKVNDGVCDCCDGSDEFDNPNAQCPNICAELVELASTSRESIYQKIRAGIRRRRESLKETQAEYPQVVREVRGLRQEMARLEHELDILNRKKAEKRKLYKIEKRQAKGVTEEQHAEKKARKKAYIYKPKKPVVVEEEPNPHGLRNIYDDDLHSSDWNVDEGIEELIFHATPRPAPIRRRDVHGGEKGSGGPHDRHDEGRVSHRKSKWKELRRAEKERAQSAKEVLGFVDKARERVKELVGKVFGTDQLKSLEELHEVEKEIEGINSAMSDIRGSLWRFDKQLAHDLGPDNAWWAIADKSFEKSKDGTDYRLTIFDHVMQRQTGTSWYGLSDGNFEGFNATGRVMNYEGGQTCWEGPHRRTEVLMYCGPSDKFLDMEETDRCIYRAHFETAIVCNEEYLDWVKGLSDNELSDFVTQWEMVE
jgi:protein kinase C substrate 80K-H